MGAFPNTIFNPMSIGLALAKTSNLIMIQYKVDNIGGEYSIGITCSLHEGSGEPDADA